MRPNLVACLLVLGLVAMPLTSGLPLRTAPTANAPTTTTSSGGGGGSDTNSTSDANGTHAANKASVAGSGIEILGGSVAAGSASLVRTVLHTTIKTSSTEDLLLYVTMECALWTKVTTVGNAESTATARVVVWVELDGQPVPVGSDDTVEPGRVVFCDRTHQQQAAGLGDNATLTQFLRTRSANAFNWVALDVGSQPSPHTLDVKAELSDDAAGVALAQAGIGHRTLIVEPIKLARGATV